MSTPDKQGEQHAALEPWQPPTPLSAQRSAFARNWIALRPAVFPTAVGIVAWTLSDHGGAHSVGDAAIGTAITAAAAATGATLSATAKRQGQRPTTIGELEPHAAMLTSRGGLVAWALAGLAALATITTYTSNPYLRVLYILLGAGVPVFFHRLTSRHADDQHLAFSQRLALEQTVTGASYRVEQLRQTGRTTRTSVTEENRTVRTRLEQDGQTRRSEVREQGATTRALLDTYAKLAASPAARGQVPAGAGSAPGGHAQALQELLGLSGAAAEALEPGALTLLGHAAAQADPKTEAESEGTGLYL